MLSKQKALTLFAAIAFALLTLANSSAETINYTYDDALRLIKAQYSEGTYVEYVYDNLGNRLLKTTTLQGAPTNTPPNAPTSPTPDSSATGVSTNPTLSWTGGDPDISNAVVYSLYLGTSSSDLPLVATGLQASFAPGQLRGMTTYYWRVVARDNHNVTTAGPLWSFTTTNNPPVASFTAENRAGWGPLTVSFSDTSQDPDGDPIVSWAWDFNGDGVVDSTAQNTTYTYNSIGSFTVTLTVIDSSGAIATKTVEAYVIVEDDDHPGPSTAIHCISNSSELQNALDTAVINGKNNVIRLVQGSYKISENGNSNFAYNVYSPFSLAIKGGYTQACSMRELNPENTVLDGEGIWSGRGVLTITNTYDTADASNMHHIVEGLTVKNGAGGGIYLRSDEGGVIISHNIIQDNSSYYSAGLNVENSNGTAIIRDNLIANNTAVNNIGALCVNTFQGKTVIVNNTIANNSAASISGGAYLRLYDSSSTLEIHNNIIWGNRASSGPDIYIKDQGGGVNAYYNIIDPAKVYGAFANSGNNINADPLFVNAAAGDYNLLVASPAREMGNNSAPFLPPTDIVGTARIIGSAVDMGAYEYISAGGSIVINNGDDYTTSSSVTLTLSVLNPTDVSEMCISNTADCSAWEAYSATKGWTLPTGDGIKTVYVWYKNDLGIINQLPFKASIVLDGTPPVINISTFADGFYTYNPFIGDAITGTVSDNIGVQSLSINGATVPIGPSGDFTYSMQLAVGANTITTVATDLAGNQKVDTRTITLYDTENPSPNTVFHCVTNGATLQAALNLAQSNNKDNVIQLVQGAYKISENNNSYFSYIRYAYAEPHALYLKGGYTLGCATRELNPTNTIFDAENIESNDVISLRDYSSSGRSYLEVDGITIQNGRGSSNDCITLISTYGAVAFKNSVIKNSNPYSFGSIGANNGAVLLSNNLINNNTAMSGANGGTYLYGRSLFVINNTFTDNTVTTAGGIAGIDLNASAFASMYNNIIWNNSAPSGVEISLRGSGVTSAFNNVLDPVKVSGIFTSAGSNINASPQFVNAVAGEYHLSPTSPAKDAGNNAAPFLPLTDIEGNPRIFGLAVDIGAHEYTDRRSQLAVLRGDSEWFLDTNSNGTWDSGIDRVAYFGMSGFVPVSGKWDGGGTAKVGSFDPATNHWHLDYNGNGIWDGPPTDRVYSFGFSGTVPVTGDWNGDGITKVGSYDPATTHWFLDYNGNGVWDGTPTDKISWFGYSGTIPVTGDWNGDGTTKIGSYDPATSTWFHDYNGNGLWDGTPTDKISWFGYSGTIPVTGDWNGDGTTNIGVFIDGQWYIDLNGNGTWDPEIDIVLSFGIPGDKPVTGRW